METGVYITDPQIVKKSQVMSATAEGPNPPGSRGAQHTEMTSNYVYIDRDAMISEIRKAGACQSHGSQQSNVHTKRD